MRHHRIHGRSTAVLHGLVALVWLWAASCAEDAASADDTAGSDIVTGEDTTHEGAEDTGAQSADCPAEHPLMAGRDLHSCPAAGLSCSWPAPACDGAKAANTCTCESGSWRCSIPFHNCLPVTDGGFFAHGERPAPGRRVATAACPAIDTAANGACTPGSFEDGTSTCANDSECDAGAVCLDTHTFGAGSLCSCHTPECTTHDDCGDGQACKCGALNASTTCGGWSDLSCAHQCIPADCRSDADCGDGGICAASPDICGWPTVKYACHHPDRDECLTDAECLGGVCQHDAALQGWVCNEMPLCE